MKDKVKIVYHKNCLDGFMAAYCAYLHFKSLPSIDVEYIAISPSSTPHIEDIEDSHIYIFDVSIDYNDFVNWTKLAKSVELYDHHISNMKNLSSLPNCYFDMNESGASLSYLKWHTNVFSKHNDKKIVKDNSVMPQSLPWYIDYARDRDLWHLKLDSTNEVSAYLMSISWTFEEYDKHILSINAEIAADRGRWILQANKKIINQILNKKSVCKWTTKDDHTYNALIVNSNTFQSELGNMLSDIDPENYSFAIIWHVEPNKYQNNVKLSLRSIGDFSVAKLAEEIGGGGHKNAAGCSIPWNLFDISHINTKKIG